MDPDGPRENLFLLDPDEGGEARGMSDRRDRAGRPWSSKGKTGVGENTGDMGGALVEKPTLGALFNGVGGGRRSPKSCRLSNRTGGGRAFASEIGARWPWRMSSVVSDLAISPRIRSPNWAAVPPAAIIASARRPSDAFCE